MKLRSYLNLREYSYFSGLSDNALKSLSEKITAVNFPAGNKIICEGAEADAFYLLENGDLEIIERTKHGESRAVTVSGKGCEPGSMPLIKSSPHCISVTSKTEATLHKILRNDFEDIACMDSVFSGIASGKEDSVSGLNEINALHPFTLVRPEKMLALADKLEERRFRKGEKIITQGEPGDKYYIIKSGSVDVLKLMFREEPEHVAALSHGQAFGEEALINNQPRNATVQAKEDTVVWALSKPDFESMMKESFLEEAAPEEVLYSKSGEPLIDVRFDIEYEEAHIPGAIHIPLDEIRRRYSELDRDRKYFIYCRSGRRSASATFLLRNQGFNAVNMQGGITAWPGEVIEG